jgi:hypothetical protein
MKRLSIITALVFACVLGVFAADPGLGSLVPKSAEIMGMGGAFAATPHGYNSFFSNPAGFAQTHGDLTLLSLNPWVYVTPSSDTLQGISDTLSGGDAFKLILPALTGNGFGIGTTAGLGLTGKGFGLGAYVVEDMYMYGKNILGIAGTADLSVNVVGGFAFKFGPTDKLKLSIGGDLRPFYRISGVVDSKTAGSLMSVAKSGDIQLDPILQAIPAYAGTGIGIDLGALLQMGPLAFGLTARDFNIPLSFKLTNVGTALAELQGGLTTGSATTVTMLPTVSAGAAFHPDLGGFSFLIDPLVQYELQDVLAGLKAKKSFWTMSHIGAQITALRFIALRGGINQGYLSIGAGVHLLILDANVAVFSEEMGKNPGDRQRSGVSLEVALRI